MLLHPFLHEESTYKVISVCIISVSIEFPPIYRLTLHFGFKAQNWVGGNSIDILCIGMFIWVCHSLIFQRSTDVLWRKLYFSTISAMPVEISHDKAYQDYLSIRKPGLKSATIENISAILQQNDVEINPKPSNPVSFYYKFGRISWWQL